MTMELMKASHLAGSAFVNTFSLLTLLTTTKHTHTHTYSHIQHTEVSTWKFSSSK